MSDIQRRGLVADLSRRLQLASNEELRLLDRALVRLEQRRDGARDHRWTRRLATGPGDTDRYFHLVRPIASRGVVQTLCRGSWPFGDLTATRANVPLGERCLACWRRAAGCDAFEGALIEAWLDLETEDRDREQLHEAVRDELMREWSEPDRGTVISGETLAIARTVTAERSDPYETVIVDPEGERR